jgi:hypothetical protein
MDSATNAATLRRASLAAFALLTSLCVLTLLSGVSQQGFEWVHPPATYAEALRRDSGWLRAIVALDDLFVAAYVTATVLLATSLAAGRWQVWHALIAAGGVAAGLLDLEENHHLLALARAAEASLPIELEEIVGRSVRSQLKWLIGHLTFVFVGLSLQGQSRIARVLRVSLIAWQLPVGALTWTVAVEPWQPLLVWLRYASFLAGFASIAWLSRGGELLGRTHAPAPLGSEPGEADSGAPG